MWLFAVILVVLLEFEVMSHGRLRHSCRAPHLSLVATALISAFSAHRTGPRNAPKQQPQAPNSHIVPSVFAVVVMVLLELDVRSWWPKTSVHLG